MSLVSGYNADSRTIQDGAPVAGKFSRLQLDRVILAGGSVLAAGLAKSGAIVGGVVTVYTEGVVEFLNWSKVTGTKYLTVGQAYRLSSQLGKITTTGSGQLIGLAVSKTQLSLQIGIGTTGSTTTTPSNTSQFATLEGLAGEAANRSSADVYLQSQIDTKAGTGFTSVSTAGDLVTGTMDSAGLSIGIPAYLTTAALSQDSSKYAGTTAGITGGSLTVDTAGVAISLPSYLTTAALSQDSSKYAGTAGAITGGSITVNTSGVSINLPSYLTTAQPVGDYAGTNTSILTTAGTDLSLAVNTSGVTVAYPKWITTYAGGAGTGFTSASTAGTAVVGTLSTNGLSLGIPAYLTTTPLGAGITNIKVSAGSYSTNRSDITFEDSNGVSFGQDTDGVITATVFTDYQSTGAYLTTAALSGDTSNYAGTSTGMTGGSVTLNTSGIAISLPAYLTTAAATNITSARAGTNTSVQTTAGTDISIALNTSGLTVAYPAYITTYVNDLTSARAGTNTSVATTAGTDLTLGVNTSGVTIGYPKWITTYVNDLTSARAGTNTSVVTTAGTDLSFAVNTSGVTIAYPAWLTTAQPAGAYLTTAALSQDSSKYAGTSTGITGGSVTLNTSGIAINLPAYLTTAALSADSSKYAGTSTGITGGSVTLNTSGIAINLPAYLTTAALSGDTTKYAGVGETVGTIAGTDLAMTVNTDGVSIGYPKWITTYVAQTNQSAIKGVGVSNTGNTAGNVGYSTGIDYALAGSGLLTLSQSTAAGAATCYIQHPAWLTTAALSADSSKYAGTSTGITGGSVTLNTSGIAINLPAYLTTAGLSADSSKYAGTSTGMTGGSVTLNTSGIAINLPAYLTTAALSADSSKYAGTSTGITGGSVTLNTSGIAISLPAYLTTAAQSSAMQSYWNNIQFVQGTSSFSLQSNSVNVQPFMLPYAISVSYLRVPVSFANLTSTTVALTAGSSSFFYYQSINAVLYSQGAGASSRSLQQFASSFAGITEAFLFSASNAGTNESIAYRITYPLEGNNTDNSASTMLTTAAGASIFLHTTGGMTNFTGIHHLDIPFATSLSAGNYWIAFNRSTSSTTSGGGIAITGNVNRAHTFIAVTQINSNFVPLGLASAGGATASTQPNFQIGLGSHSVSAQGATTASLALSSISSVANFPIIPMQFIRQA